jgi:hypothetical protein
MEAVQSSETLVNSYQSARRYNPEDGHLHSHSRENLKSYTGNIYQISEINFLGIKKFNMPL